MMDLPIIGKEWYGVVYLNAITLNNVFYLYLCFKATVAQW